MIKQQCDNKIDVYAFGILMYEIVTNSIAFPELEIELISKEDFTNKIVKENYRPAVTNEGIDIDVKFEHP